MRACERVSVEPIASCCTRHTGNTRARKGEKSCEAEKRIHRERAKKRETGMMHDIKHILGNSANEDKATSHFKILMT